MWRKTFAAAVAACMVGCAAPAVDERSFALSDEEIIAGLEALFLDVPSDYDMLDFERLFHELDAAYRSAAPCLECDDPPPLTCEFSATAYCFLLQEAKRPPPPPPKVPSKEAIADLRTEIKGLEDQVKGDKGLKKLTTAREDVAKVRKDVQEIDKSLKKLVDEVKGKGKIDADKQASLQRSIDLALEDLEAADEALDAAECAFKGAEKALAKAAATLKKVETALAAMPPDKDKAAFLNVHATELIEQAKQFVTKTGVQLGGRGVMRLNTVTDGLKGMRDQLKALMGQ